jgi:hypothetical protein
MRLLESLWVPERQRLVSEIDNSNAVTVSAAEGEIALSVVNDALKASPERPVARVDFARLVTPEAAAGHLAREVAGIITGDPKVLTRKSAQLSADETRRLLDARRMLGPAFEVLDGDSGQPDEVAVQGVQALAAHSQRVGQRPVLLLIGAERALVDDKLAQLMWPIRSAAQSITITVVFCGGPAIGELTASKNAAFFGWGTELALGLPDPDAMQQAVLRELSEAFARPDSTLVAERITEYSQGVVSVAEQLTEMAMRTEEPVDVDALWRDLVDQHGPRLRVLAAATASLHSQAIPVLTALARAEAPYASFPRNPSAVSRAITAMRVAGLIDRRGPRAWRLVDPLFAAWLAG